MKPSPKPKGQWLRTVTVQQGPTLQSKGGKRPTKAKVAEFEKWDREINRQIAEETDISVILSKMKPKLADYLKSEGFAVSSENSNPMRDDGSRAMLSEIYETHPKTYAAYRACLFIAEIEAALDKGDTARACGWAFQLGVTCKEANALAAFDKKFAKKTGAVSVLRKLYDEAIDRLKDRGENSPKIINIKFEMTRDPQERCKKVCRSFQYQTLKGRWQNFPARFKATASEWKRKRTQAQ